MKYRAEIYIFIKHGITKHTQKTGTVFQGYTSLLLWKTTVLPQTLCNLTWRLGKQTILHITLLGFTVKTHINIIFPPVWNKSHTPRHRQFGLWVIWGGRVADKLTHFCLLRKQFAYKLWSFCFSRLWATAGISQHGYLMKTPDHKSRDRQRCLPQSASWFVWVHLRIAILLQPPESWMKVKECDHPCNDSFLPGADGILSPGASWLWLR